MINKKMTSSVVAFSIASILAGCNTSNEEGLEEVSGIAVVEIPLVCQTPDSIKVNSLGDITLDNNNAPSCERVQLACVGQVYDSVTHSCLAKGRHENAPDELADASTDGRPDFATIFFSRDDLTEDSVDSGLILHAWNNENCNAYDPDYIIPGDTQDPEAGDYWDTDYQTGIKPDGFDPNYGLYWTFKLLEGHSNCANFIIHDENTKFPDGDMLAYLSADENDTRYNEDRMNYVLNGITVPGNASIFPYYSEAGDPTDGLRELLTDRPVHWFNLDTLLLNDNAAQSIRIYSAEQMPLLFPGEGFRGLDYVEFTRTDTALSADELTRALYRSGMSQFVANTPNDPTVVKNMLKGRVMAVLVDDNGDPYSGYLVQTAGVLDALYTMGDNDADEATLGVQYNGSSVSASVWAPTAQDVKLKLYSERDAQGDYAETASHDMSFNIDNGIWTYEGDRSVLDRQLFRYEVSVYHPTSDTFETYEVIDPYAVSVTTNGRLARFVDLNDDDLKPANWDNHTIPTINNPEDIVVYESHIRDFSIMDESTTAENRGKYLAFTETTSAPVEHLKTLKDAGVTLFQILPSNDIATINEDAANTVDLTDTVADLCAQKSTLAICSVGNAGNTIIEELSQFEPSDNTHKETLQALNDLDGFNWGYDPYIFNAPEGSYASDAESVSRIVEMRSMIQALHDIGLRASIDVVYNHTSASGLWDNSVFDKIVPGYYHRLDVETGAVLTSSCCDDTAGENRMFAKFVKESLASWAEHFKFDAFRFDLMNLLPQSLIVEARDTVRMIDPDTYFYGEGWNFGAIVNTGATVANLTGTQIGTFSDLQRDGVRNSALFNTDGNRQEVDLIRLGLVANMANYVLQSESGNFDTLNNYPRAGLAQDPADVVNYVSKHDNETLWDQLQFGQSDDLSSADRARIHAVAGSFPILSQGIPFLQMGSDLLRSKSMNRNSYDSGDIINRVDFTMSEHNWNSAFPAENSCSSDDCDNQFNTLISNDNRKASSGEIEWAANVYQDLFKIRASSNLFRLTTAEQIIDRVGFHNTGAAQTHGVIVMSIDDGAGCINSTKDFLGNCDAETDLRPDLDPNYDGIVVVFNGTDAEQTMTVATASGFTLHAIQVASADTEISNASFSESNNQFTVPALTTAVFVQTQNGSQGTGINAFATIGVPDIAPYGVNTVYVKGTMNDWGNVDMFSYEGEATYEAVIELAAGSYQFKIADTDWSYPNVGGGIEVPLGDETMLGANGNDLSLTIVDAGKYKFVLNATNPNMPLLTVKALVEAPPYEPTVYIRGTVNSDGGWNTNDPLLFVGNKTYVTSITLTAGDYLFKLASEDWSTVNIGSGSINNAVLNTATPLDGGGDMNLTIAEDGIYTFSIDASDTAVPVVTVSHDTQPYTATPLYIRGFDGDWGTTNEMTYYGNGYYGLVLPFTSDTQFKIASSDWSTANLGGSGNVINEELALTYNDGDLLLTGLSPTNLQFILKVNDDSTHDATATVIDLSDY
jgi:pullulanase